MQSEDEDAMDQDVPMNDDSKSKTGDGLDEYNLENYDDDDAMPGIPPYFFPYGSRLTVSQLWVHLVTSRA